MGNRDERMIQLPSNITPALLGLLLGLLVGAGITYYLASPTERATYEGLQAIELDRYLAPDDTTGQDEPRTEIRYRTRVDTLRDTLRVPVPQSLADGAVISDRTPLDLTPERATWTYWDPLDRRYEQRVFNVPQDRFNLSAYALVEAWSPLHDVNLGPERVHLGLGVGLRYKRLRARVEALTTPTLSRQRVGVGVLYRF